MRVFEHPNMSFSKNWNCHICKTKADKPVVFIPVRNAGAEDNIVECRQIHVECLNLTWHIGNGGSNILYQFM